jgi:class 3 adenylate cyclase
MADLEPAPKHPLDPIARIFDSVEPSGESNPADDKSESSASVRKEPAAGSQRPLMLTPSETDSPAFFIDSDLRLIWQNRPAANQLWHNSRQNGNGSASPHLFDLLLGSQFQTQVDNWRQWLTFFLYQALQILPEDELVKQIRLRDSAQQELLLPLLRSASAQTTSPLKLDRVVDQTRTHTYRITVCQFREGRYFIFEPDDDDRPVAHPAVRRLEQLDLRREPVQMDFFALAAKLSNADTLQTELLPAEYSHLSSAVMNRCYAIIDTYDAIVEPLADRGLVAYFFSENHRHDPTTVIDCALEIKSQLDDLNREWKIRTGWLHDIELNMAMHYANEFVGTLPTAMGMSFRPFGSALTTCMRLCEMAVGGQIWSTKALIRKMNAQQIKTLRFGICRTCNHRQVLVENCFSRMMDLPGGDAKTTAEDTYFGPLAVTQIFDRKIG